MSAFRQNLYDIAFVTFPVGLVITLCFIIHGIAQGWQ
ncbi:hypothetical protein BN961_02157 [Afipia felis]|uniref:Uncharacterized protein n=1 Tax=Afipia felis TaxID=1035 RepID=A0A090MSZ9_AFIFE|nr:hypothetical protein BN961_02157 [Afipia felis]